jgi:predicted enzyme related to lactoylglutathione lyase
MTQSLDLAWIVVKDLKKAVKFYTETVGLKLLELHEEFGWAELQGPDGGARLGIGVENDKDPIKAGTNACVTFTHFQLAQIFSKSCVTKKSALYSFWDNRTNQQRL